VLPRGQVACLFPPCFNRHPPQPYYDTIGEGFLQVATGWTWKSAERQLQMSLRLKSLALNPKPLLVGQGKILRLNFEAPLRAVFPNGIPPGLMTLSLGPYPSYPYCVETDFVAMWIFESDPCTRFRRMYKATQAEVDERVWRLEGQVEKVFFSPSAGPIWPRNCRCPVYLRASGLVGGYKIDQTLILVFNPEL
jgi:hypothetical protein